ncbi:15410_t:CDS:2 [Cetraspora pellucida]|uniref:15410_t:CDS:1 n=1 Tax=Cetraspora pellucida TaxID=1433469 RepID=A0ACA9KIK9_9GLOM|nr:15410_t:CDS:2 [Cetraspora pellucida]
MEFLYKTSFGLKETHNFNQESNVGVERVVAHEEELPFDWSSFEKVQEMIASSTEEMEDEFLENNELLESDDETEILEEESDKPILPLDLGKP